MTPDSVPAKVFPKNSPREIFGWTMYDWANSAFSTTVVGAMFGPYLTRLAQDAVGENGVVISFGVLGAVTAKSLSTFAISVAVFLQVFLLPLIGGIADYSDMKKRLMAFFAYAGVVATCLMFFVAGNLYLGGAILFIWANLAFGAALVCYNAFLPEICTEDQRDKVSSRGFAYGYLGGGLLLALNLGLVLGSDWLGISKSLAVRLSLLSAGLWWGGFSIITFRRLKRRAAVRALPPGQNVLTAGFTELISTFREFVRLRHTLKYLIGFLLYNDGIQTVIGASAVFLEQELFRSRGLDPNPAFLIGIFLLVQFVAFGGALLFERIARLVGTKWAIMISLVIWSGLVVYAYAFFHTVKQAWVMSAVIGVVLGGSQALSRSLFSRMIPTGREASFFGLYEISERGTSWLGPLVFSIVVANTGSYRQAILSLIVFFILGMVILALTDTDRAVHEAGNALPEEVKT